MCDYLILRFTVLITIFISQLLRRGSKKKSTQMPYITHLGKTNADWPYAPSILKIKKLIHNIHTKPYTRIGRFQKNGLTTTPTNLSNIHCQLCTQQQVVKGLERRNSSQLPRPSSAPKRSTTSKRSEPGTNAGETRSFQYGWKIGRGRCPGMNKPIDLSYSQTSRILK